MAIHPTAIIHPTAEIHETAEIGPYVFIDEGCVVGEDNVLMMSAVLGRNTVLGKGNVVHHHALIGGDPQYIGFKPETESGIVVGDRNTFREFSQMHRAYHAGENTRIGNDNYFMATSHVGHDCLIGNNVIFANYSGCAGHCTVEDRVFVSSLVGIHQFCRIGKMAMIGGRTGIPKDVPPFSIAKHYGVVMGINVIGLRRAGIGPEGRMALREAYRELFRTGRPLSNSIDLVRQQYKDQEMPEELAYFLDFCAVPSKRGISRGPRKEELALDSED